MPFNRQRVDDLGRRGVRVEGSTLGKRNHSTIADVGNGQETLKSVIVPLAPAGVPGRDFVFGDIEGRRRLVDINVDDLRQRMTARRARDLEVH